MIGNVVPLVFDEKAEIYNGHGINFGTLNHLEDIGLVQFAGLLVSDREVCPRDLLCTTMVGGFAWRCPRKTTTNLILERSILTKIGQELAPICGSKPVDGFYEYVKDQWKQYLPKVENTEQKE